LQEVDLALGNTVAVVEQAVYAFNQIGLLQQVLKQ
jgi:hypothetical protein